MPREQGMPERLAWGGGGRSKEEGVQEREGGGRGMGTEEGRDDGWRGWGGDLKRLEVHALVKRVVPGTCLY
jgi:hypothetical protein